MNSNNTNYWCNLLDIRKIAIKLPLHRSFHHTYTQHQMHCLQRTILHPAIDSTDHCE